MTRNAENLRKVLETNGRPTRDVARCLVQAQIARQEADMQIVEYLTGEAYAHTEELQQFPQKVPSRKKQPD